MTDAKLIFNQSFDFLLLYLQWANIGTQCYHIRIPVISGHVCIGFAMHTHAKVGWGKKSLHLFPPPNPKLDVNNSSSSL